jgi:hypothetical protein
MGQAWAIALSAQNRGCDGFTDARWDTTEGPPRQANPVKIDRQQRVESHRIRENRVDEGAARIRSRARQPAFYRVPGVQALSERRLRHKLARSELLSVDAERPAS